MAEIIKTYRQAVPAARFIGKKYGDADCENGMFAHKWSEWFTNNLFAPLEALQGGSAPFFEDSDAYIGLMRFKEGEPFEYWIGMFQPVGTTAPAGYECVDFPALNLGVSWIYGPERELYMLEDECADKLRAEGFEFAPDDNNAYWFFERYACPRFTAPDDKGNVILDICLVVK